MKPLFENLKMLPFRDFCNRTFSILLVLITPFCPLRSRLKKHLPCGSCLLYRSKIESLWSKILFGHFS